MSDAAFEIAASGMAAQRALLDVIAENLANANVARANGGDYRAKVAVFESVSPFSQALQTASGDDFEVDFPSLDGEDAPEPRGVRLAAVVDGGASEPQLRFDPTNPLAAKNGPHKGYVSLTDVDPIEQMIGLVAAGRAYDANVAALQAAKQMEIESVDVGRS